MRLLDSRQGLSNLGTAVSYECISSQQKFAQLESTANFECEGQTCKSTGETGFFSADPDPWTFQILILTGPPAKQAPGHPGSVTEKATSLPTGQSKGLRTLNTTRRSTSRQRVSPPTAGAPPRPAMDGFGARSSRTNEALQLKHLKLAESLDTPGVSGSLLLLLVTLRCSQRSQLSRPIPEVFVTQALSSLPAMVLARRSLSGNKEVRRNKEQVFVGNR